MGGGRFVRSWGEKTAQNDQKRPNTENKTSENVQQFSKNRQITRMIILIILGCLTSLIMCSSNFHQSPLIFINVRQFFQMFSPSESWYSKDTMFPESFLALTTEHISESTNPRI